MAHKTNTNMFKRTKKVSSLTTDLNWKSVTERNLKNIAKYLDVKQQTSK